MICAAVTDDDDADGVADGAIEELALFFAGVTDGVELADGAVGACDDDGGGELFAAAG